MHGTTNIKFKLMCSTSILMPAALFMHYTTCCLVCDLWYVYSTGSNQSVSGQVTQVATPLVHQLLPYFNNFFSNLHYLTAKMGWYTGMSHPHLFSCCMRDILQQSSKVQAWTLGSLNQCFPQFYAQFYWSCQNLQKTVIFPMNIQLCFPPSAPIMRSYRA